MKYMDAHITWLTDYHDSDIDPYAKALDLGLPLAYGFVIPRALMHSTFLPIGVQQKLIPLFELAQHHSAHEIEHSQKLIHKIIEGIKIFPIFLRQIHTSYESLLEHERKYLRLHVTDLHRAHHILRHVYAPPPVSVRFLPNTPATLHCAGEQSLVHTIALLVIESLKKNLISGASPHVQSVLVQRMYNGQYSGYCDTTNTVRSMQNQLVVYGNAGARMLDEAGDMYIVDKENMQIIDKHVLTQPFKYTLKGAEYKKIALHEQDGDRQTLPDSLVLKVAYTAKDVEKKLYFPHRVHWTFENGLLYITKLRPL